VYIKASTEIMNNYNEISMLCKETGEPVYLTKTGEGDLVVIDIDAFTRIEKMLALGEKLLSIRQLNAHLLHTILSPLKILLTILIASSM